jgi:hypothetical protein
MNVSLLSVCMQMSDPAADTYVSELDDTDAELVVAICAVDVWGRTMSQVPRRALVETGIQWVERTLQNSNDCFDMFRMRRTVFRRLHDTLVDNYGLLPSRGVSTTEALGIFLWACGGPQSFRQLRNKFGHSLETISRKYTEVLDALFKMSCDIIKPKDPHFIEIHPRLREARF